MTKSTPPTSPDEVRRVTETGPEEQLDRRPHGVATALTIAGMIAVMIFGLMALAQNIEGDGETVVTDRVVLPRFDDRQWSDAQRQLENLGLLVDVEFAPNERIPQNTVVDQQPIAGARVEVGSVVTLIVSDGPIGLQVPEILGLQSYEAVDVLVLNQLQFSTVEVFHDTIRPGAVVSTDPPPGAWIASQAVVELSISKGPEPRVVPDILDKLTPEALPSLVEQISTLGRSPRTVTDMSEAYRVVTTNPSAGEEVPPNYPIAVTITQFSTLTIPDLTGMSPQVAQRVAREMGFSTTIVRESLPMGDRRGGIVLRQTPFAGTVGEDGMTITVYQGVAPTPPPPTTTPPPPGEGD